MHRRARSRYAWIVAAFSLGATGFGCRAILGVHDYGDTDDSPGDAAVIDAVADAPTDGAIVLPDGAICTPAAPDPRFLSNATQVVAGIGFSCALIEGGTVACWGDNEKIQLGKADKTIKISPTPLLVAGLDHVTKLAAGESHVCALRDDHTLRCWGDNSSFQLGNAIATPSVPLLVGGGAQYDDVVAGGAHTCVLQEGVSRPVCWGENGEFELSSDSGSGPTPHQIVSPTTILTVTQLAAGEQHSCSFGGGQVGCWGGGADGELGIGDAKASRFTLAFAGTPAITAVRAGGRDTCVLTTGGIFCAGTNRDGQLGGATQPPTVFTPTPVALATLPGAVDIALGGAHSCLWNSAQQLFCVGDNLAGELGNGIRDGSPTLIASAVVGIDGGVVFGPLLDNGNETVAVAGDFDGLASEKNFGADAASFPRHTCAILAENCRNSGTVYCWGSNEAGEVGAGNFDMRLVPTPTPVVAP